MVDAPKAVLLKVLVCTLERQTLKVSVELRQHQKDGVRGRVIVLELALQLPLRCQSQEVSWRRPASQEGFTPA